MLLTSRKLLQRKLLDLESELRGALRNFGLKVGPVSGSRYEARVRDDRVCRRLMTAPGVGAVVALTYRATIDQPQRFVHSRAVGAHVGRTPKRYQSGETNYEG